MDIHIIKHTETVPDRLILGEYALKTEVREDGPFPGVFCCSLFICHLKKNKKEEILTRYKKILVGDIYDCSCRSEDIYFTSYETSGDETIIFLHRYDYLKNEVETVYSYREDFSLFPKHMKIQFFILNDTYILIQRSHLRSNLSETYQGFFDFEQSLYHMRDKTEVKIKDENFTNNGIAFMEALSPTELFIKTGFSLLKDLRYQKLESDEMSVEGLCRANTARMISELSLTQNNMIVNMIDQAFRTKTFVCYFVRHPYIVYSIYEIEEKRESVMFYHIEKQEILCTYINENVKNESMFSKPLIIAGSPYIQMTGEDGTYFYNLLEKEKILHLPSREKFITCVGNYILTSAESRGLFGKVTTRVQIKQVPNPLSDFMDMETIHSEKGEFAGVLSDEEHIYLFLR